MKLALLSLALVLEFFPMQGQESAGHGTLRDPNLGLPVVML